MNTNDALETASRFPGALIVPVHFQDWQHFTQNQDDLEKAFAALGVSGRLRIVSPGGELTLPL